MSDPGRAYRSRLLTHEELIAHIKPGGALSFGTWMGQPHGVMRALVRHGRHLDPLHVFCAPASDVGELLMLPNVHCVSSFLGPAERAAQRNRGNVAYVPTHYTDYHKSLRTNRLADFYLVRAAPMDERGFFNLSLSASWQFGALRWLPRNAPDARIVVRHILPNVISQAIVFAMSDIVLDILAIVTLGYLGLGVPPPTPDWGSMISDGQPFLTTQWQLSTIPGIAVIITGLGLSLLGDGLNDLLRPE